MISVAYTSQYPKFNILKLYLFTLRFYNGGKKLQNNIQGLHERFVQIIWRLIINIFFNRNYQKNHTRMNLLFYGYCDSKTAHGHSHVNLKFGMLHVYGIKAIDHLKIKIRKSL